MIQVTQHTTQESKLSLSVNLSEQSIKQFQALLNRALNCAPEFGADWFELSSRLDQFIAKHNL